MSATVTFYASECVWGSSSFNSTTDLKVGKTGSSSSDGTKYKGRLTFDAIPSNWIIRSVTLKLNRIDSYNAHTLLFGGSTGSGFSASLSFSLTQSISKGTGSKSIDLTDYASVMQGFGAAWYLHIRHGSGTNSYTEFNGDEDANSKKPQIVIVYDLATVWYFKDGAWVECEVWYRNGDAWVKVIPYYNSGGTWVQV